MDASAGCPADSDPLTNASVTLDLRCALLMNCWVHSSSTITVLGRRHASHHTDLSQLFHDGRGAEEVVPPCSTMEPPTVLPSNRLI